MATQYISLPLYQDADYQYEIALEGNAYSLRIYYNSRCHQWVFDLLTAENTPLLMGVALVAMYPITFDYVLGNLTGFFLLEPIGDSYEKYRTDPENLYKYFRLFYLYDNGEA